MVYIMLCFDFLFVVYTWGTPWTPLTFSGWIRMLTDPLNYPTASKVRDFNSSCCTVMKKTVISFLFVFYLTCFISNKAFC